MSEITSLEPRLVWEQFDAITRVPRPSKKEGKIIDFLVDFAKKHHIEYKKDAIGNVVMRKPATPGMEERAAVILQSHMDMVCEKNSDVEFDFDNDPIRTRIDGEWVRAEGTTLGADCGIGMAAALAVMLDETVEHGPVEALFTVDEETGLTGAFELGEGMLTGKYLVNLDSEDEGEIFIGCAGGIDTIATFHYTMEPSPKNYTFFRVDVSDLQGGHSGDDIDKGRVNSNKTVARLLWDGMQSFELKLCYFNGGNLRNAIPREAYAIFGVPARFKEEFVKRYNLFAADLEAEFRFREPNFKITLNEMPHVDEVLDSRTQSALVYSLVGVPNGVVAMSFAVPGLVETSTNLASVKFAEAKQTPFLFETSPDTVPQTSVYMAWTIRQRSAASDSRRQRSRSTPNSVSILCSQIFRVPYSPEGKSNVARSHNAAYVRANESRRTFVAPAKSAFSREGSSSFKYSGVITTKKSISVIQEKPNPAIKSFRPVPREWRR